MIDLPLPVQLHQLLSRLKRYLLLWSSFDPPDFHLLANAIVLIELDMLIFEQLSKTQKKI